MGCSHCEPADRTMLTDMPNAKQGPPSAQVHNVADGLLFGPVQQKEQSQRTDANHNKDALIMQRFNALHSCRLAAAVSP